MYLDSVVGVLALYYPQYTFWIQVMDDWSFGSTASRMEVGIWWLVIWIHSKTYVGRDLQFYRVNLWSYFFTLISISNQPSRISIQQQSTYTSAVCVILTWTGCWHPLLTPQSVGHLLAPCAVGLMVLPRDICPTLYLGFTGPLYLTYPICPIFPPHQLLSIHYWTKDIHMVPM